jgi:hypothetical protein
VEPALARLFFLNKNRCSLLEEEKMQGDLMEKKILGVFLVALLALMQASLAEEAKAFSDDKLVTGMAKEGYTGKILPESPASPHPQVAISLDVAPKTVLQGNSFEVIEKITYLSPITASSGKMTFKVVTRYKDFDGHIVPLKAEDKTKFLSVGDIIKDAFGAEKKEAIFPSGKEGKVIMPQQRVDYITLAPGQSAVISSYFKTQTAGIKQIIATLYISSAECESAKIKEEKCAALIDKQIAQAVTDIVVVEKLEEMPNLPSLSLHFERGWNMVSLPLGSKPIPLSSISSECKTDGIAWMYSKNGYAKTDVLTPGVGYWIKGYQACTFDTGGIYTASPLEYASGSFPQLSSGWNLVGTWAERYKISEIYGSCKIISGPWHYNPSAGKYEYSEELVPGRSYWLKVQSSCVLGSPESSPPAPPEA